MGRLPVIGQDVDFDPRCPPEDHDNGCPGAWYRCDFANSLERYERLLTESGFASNMLADRTDDRLIIEAMQYIERERLRARAHWAETRAEKR